MKKIQIRKSRSIQNFLIFCKKFGILIFPIFLYFIPVDWLNSQHSICLFKNIFGVECIGCGITRAIISAVQFDFVGAYHYNRLVIVVLPILMYVWGKMVFEIIKDFKEKHYTK